MRITRATVDDADVLAHLNEAIHDLHCQISPAFFQRSPRTSVSTEFAKMLAEEDTCVFVAWDADTPVGYCVLKIIERAPNAWTRGFRRLLVDQLSVEPGYRRRGVGSRLMEASFEFAHERGIGEVTLEYWSTNVEAREFYKAMGFVPITEKVLLALPD